MIKNTFHTPMIALTYQYKEKKQVIYVKLEFYNPSGSIKDRIAYYMICKAQEDGRLKENMPIVEVTSGNTGIALASLGAYHKHPVVIFIPDWVSKERMDLMKLYGATVIPVSREEGGFGAALAKAKQYAEENNGFWTNQFANADNVLAHYETTGVEILEQMPVEIGGFVSGIGTGGTIIGVGRRLKERDKKIQIVALEPDKMPLLTQGKIIEPHIIEGIGDDFVPEILDRSLLDDIYVVNDEDSCNMAKLLAKKLGLGVGISSGANMLAAVMLGQKVTKSVVTVFADDNKKYLSTALNKEIDLNPNFLSNEIELIGYESV